MQSYHMYIYINVETGYRQSAQVSQYISPAHIDKLKQIFYLVLWMVHMWIFTVFTPLYNAVKQSRKQKKIL